MMPALALVLLTALDTTTTAPLPTTDQVLARLVEADRARAALLRGYVSMRRYEVHNRRFGTRAAMTARMNFRAPGEKNFEVLETSGPGPIRSQVFQRMIESEQKASRDAERRANQISPENYDFRLLRQENLDGRPAFVLQAEPKTKNPLLFRGSVWIDAEDWAVIRIEGSPAQKPSFWVKKTSFVHRYQKFGPFWFAVSNHSESDVRIFGHTDVDIRYSDYQIDQHIAGTN